MMSTARTFPSVRFRRLSLPLMIAAAVGGTSVTSQDVDAAVSSEHSTQTPNYAFHHTFGPTDYASAITLAQNSVSKSKAASLAKESYGGKVLKVTQSGSNYRVKLLMDNGRIKIVTVTSSGKVK